jgi:hypothetical protein
MTRARMPLWQRAVLAFCILGIGVTVAPLAVPNPCGDFDVTAAFRHKGELPADVDRPRERACINDSREEMGRLGLTALIAGPLLVALVVMPAVVRRASIRAQRSAADQSAGLPRGDA